MLSLLSSFVLAFNNRVMIRYSAADQTKIWTMAVNKYASTAVAMFIVNAKDRVCSNCHSGNIRFDGMSRSILFRLPAKIPAPLVYSCL